MIHPLFDQHQYKEIDASGEKRHQPTGPQHGVPFDTGAGIVHQNLDKIEKQAENYAVNPQNWYGLWFDGLIPLVYLANGKKIYFKNKIHKIDERIFRYSRVLGG